MPLECEASAACSNHPALHNYQEPLLRSIVYQIEKVCIEYHKQFFLYLNSIVVEV
jgi:hypothetical protein